MRKCSIFTSTLEREEDDDLVRVRGMILTGNMPIQEAQNLIDNISTAEIDTSHQYAMHLAALSAVFADEVRKTATDGRTIRQILHTHTAGNRMVISKYKCPWVVFHFQSINASDIQFEASASPVSQVNT